MSYQKITLRQDFPVEELISIHYFEYFKDFSFEGESHDFWEFLCVDKGQVSVTAGEECHQLSPGNIIFHKPMEFHSVKANGISAPNLVVVSFTCNSKYMNFFEHKIFSVDDFERNLLASIVTEAGNAFSTPLDDPYTTRMVRLEHPEAGAEQMIRLCLEHLLIHLYRRRLIQEGASSISRSMKLRHNEETYGRILAYMEERIGRQLSIEQICRDNLIGRSQLQKLFRERCSCGVIDHFSRMKISHAKRLIREESLNFTQIADYLGYTSVHYFSRQFKKITGMTPSEYASSIKLLAEKPENRNAE